MGLFSSNKTPAPVIKTASTLQRHRASRASVSMDSAVGIAHDLPSTVSGAAPTTPSIAFDDPSTPPPTATSQGFFFSDTASVRSGQSGGPLSFASDLWDNLDAVDCYTQESVQSATRFMDYLTKRSALDVEYARQIQKLNKSFAPPMPSVPKKSNQTPARSSLDQTLFDWLQLDSQVAEHWAVDLQQSLDQQVLQPARQFTRQYAVQRQQYFQEIRQLRKALSAHHELRMAAEKTSMARQQKADQALRAFEVVDKDLHATKLSVQKHKEAHVLAQQKADEAHLAYSQAHQACEQQNALHFDTALPAQLNALQQLEESRVRQMHQFLLQTLQQRLHWLNQVSTLYEQGSQQCSQQVDVSQDLQRFIRANRIGGARPTLPPVTGPAASLVVPALKSTPSIAATTGNPVNDELATLPDNDQDVLTAGVDASLVEQRLTLLQRVHKALEKRYDGLARLNEAYEREPAWADVATRARMQSQVDDMARQVSQLADRMTKLQALNERELSPSATSPFMSPPMTPPPQMHVTAMYDFNGAQDTDELTVQSGDRLVLLDRGLDEDGNETGWWRVQRPETGEEGYVPNSYLAA